MKKRNSGREYFRRSFSLMFLLLSLVGGVFYLQRDNAFYLLSEATGEKAELEVFAQAELGEMNQSWRHFAQGGEDMTVNLLDLASDKIASLSAQTVRIDHIYDGYKVVGRDEQGKLTFNFEKLDEVVEAITGMGAAPMLALSYMPEALTDGDILSQPRDWNEWAEVVKQTVEHYSGELAIENVAYEVWNEPDLFGKWETDGDKNYLTLYYWSVAGAGQAQVQKEYQIGGPAITGVKTEFLRDFFAYVVENNLRLDFVSWHRYGKDISVYEADVDTVMREMAKYNRLLTPVRPFYITESGPNGDLDPVYDDRRGAAHAVAAVRAGLDHVSRIYTFELVDGKDPGGSEFWGRWGLLTHPDFGAAEKPRYEAMKMLNELEGKRLLLVGEGTWVRAIAGRNGTGEIAVVAVNYDSFDRHLEETPLTIRDLEPGNYRLEKELLGGGKLEEKIEVAEDRSASTLLSLPPSGVMLVRLIPE